MNAWLVGAAVLLGLLVPLALVAARVKPLEATAALQLAGALTTLALVLLSEGFARPAYFWTAEVFAPLSFVGTLAFIRVLGRWL